MQNNEKHQSCQTVCWRHKCVEWETDESSGHVCVFHRSQVQTCAPHIHGLNFERPARHRADALGFKGILWARVSVSRDCFFQISHCAVKWQKSPSGKLRKWPKHSLWSCHKEVAVMIPSKGVFIPSGFSVGRLGRALCTDITPYGSSKFAGSNQKMWSHSCGRRKAFLGIPSQGLIIS